MNKRFAALMLICFIATTVASAKQTQTFQQYTGTTNMVPQQQYTYTQQTSQYYVQPTAFQNYAQNNVALPPIQVPVNEQYTTNLTAPQLQVNDYVMPQTEQVSNVATQQQYYAQQQQQTYTQPLQGQVVMISAGTSFPAVTQMAYSTANMSLGQTVALVLPEGFYYNGIEVAPAGSTVQGTVIKMRKAGRATRNGELQIKFTSIITPYGQNIPIAGSIKTDDGTGVIHGGTKFDTTKGYAKDLAVGAASGAALGTAMGALSGGKVGRGAVYGTALGAGIGLAKSFWDKGDNVEIPVNACVEILLEQPLSFNPAQYR